MILSHCPECCTYTESTFNEKCDRCGYDKAREAKRKKFKESLARSLDAHAETFRKLGMRGD